MNLNSLKKFAQEMRRDFIAQVGARLDFVLSHDDEFLRAHDQEKRKLIELVKMQGREALVDEAAYLWFNRLAAFRYMDARGYTSPRVLSPRPGESQPELLSDIKAGRVPEGLNQLASRFEALLSGRIRSLQPDREVYKEALLATCNAWASAMPWLFAKVEDWAGLLLPQDILSPDSLVARIVSGLSEDDCAQGVEIIGWLYQFYISEKKDEVFAALKKNVKISKENIPAATQLFTPHWIVRFMVENSLGRLWLLNHPESRLKERMKYFVESDPEPDYLKVKDPTELKCLDPCCGSGHILAYFFDLLYAIYEEEGYAPQEIPSLIVRHNIFGIDIDERAAELAAFTLAMVAREKDKRFFDRGIIPNVIAMRDINVDLRKLNVRLSPALQESLELLKEGRNYGSLIPAPSGAGEEIAEVEVALQSHRYDDLFGSAERVDLGIAFRILSYLEPRYHVVVTNPPYMGNQGITNVLLSFLRDHYPDSCTDLYSAFIQRCIWAVKEDGFIGMMTPFVWLYTQRFSKLRFEILKNNTIKSIVKLEEHSFSEATVSICTFVICKNKQNSHSVLIDLKNFYGASLQDCGFITLLNNPGDGYTKIKQDLFLAIPENPIAIGISKKSLECFSKGKCEVLDYYGKTRRGLQTGNTDKYIRFWPEIELKKFTVNYIKKTQKWVIMVNGGAVRKWYGNFEYVVDWDNNGYSIKNSKNSIIPNEELYFKKAITWSRLTSKALSFRYVQDGIMPGDIGPCFYSNTILPIIALLNSKILIHFQGIINPTVTAPVGDIAKTPIILPRDNINEKSRKAISISCADWDSRETSCNFFRSTLITSYENSYVEIKIDENFTNYNWLSIYNPGTDIKIENRIRIFNEIWKSFFKELHSIEEENNRIFIDLYGLQDELKPEVPYTEITILQEELVESARREQRIEFDESVLARQFVSYGVGCLMGRYSVDKDGLILADAGVTLDDFKAKVPHASFLPDEDAILPLTDEDDFSDDLPTRFKAWLRVISGKYFEDNLRWIEERLGKDIRSYFIRDFYKDHLRRYKNRPIYWMISSPSGSFRTLMYLHRYTKDTVGKVLNDYLRPYRNKTEQKLRGLQGIMDSPSASQSDKVKAKKRAAQLEKISAELDLWEKDVVYPTALARIELDLDDGVKVNYRKLSAILEPVKQLEAKEEE